VQNETVYRKKDLRQNVKQPWRIYNLGQYISVCNYCC
jgi:hypothetical protein